MNNQENMDNHCMGKCTRSVDQYKYSWVCVLQWVAHTPINSLLYITLTLTRHLRGFKLNTLKQILSLGMFSDWTACRTW